MIWVSIQTVPYVNAIESLMYVMLGTRLSICFIVGLVMRLMVA